MGRVRRWDGINGMGGIRQEGHENMKGRPREFGGGFWTGFGIYRIGRGAVQEGLKDREISL
jgi:hypothetical protein